MSEYAGYTLKTLLAEVTLPQLMRMLQAIGERKKKKFIENLHAFRIAFHSQQDDYIRFIDTLENAETLVQQANVISAKQLKKVPGFSMEKKK